MNRRSRYETNQRLARLEARLDALDPNPTGPPRAVPLDTFRPDLQAEFLRDGRVYNGQVY